MCLRRSWRTLKCGRKDFFWTMGRANAAGACTKDAPCQRGKGGRRRTPGTRPASAAGYVGTAGGRVWREAASRLHDLQGAAEGQAAKLALRILRRAGSQVQAASQWRAHGGEGTAQLVGGAARGCMFWRSQGGRGGTTLPPWASCAVMASCCFHVMETWPEEGGGAACVGGKRHWAGPARRIARRNKV